MFLRAIWDAGGRRRLDPKGTSVTNRPQLAKDIRTLVLSAETPAEQEALHRLYLQSLKEFGKLINKPIIPYGSKTKVEVLKTDAQEN